VSSHYTDYVAACALCGDVQPTRDLIRVRVQLGPYGPPKMIARLCDSCAVKLADWLGAEVPDLETVRRQKLPALFRRCFRFSSSQNKFCPHCGAPMESEVEE